jgi:hypothetical protein
MEPSRQLESGVTHSACFTFAEAGFIDTPMKILHEGSLIQTVDSFNEAVFFGYPWQQEAKTVMTWLSGQLGKPGAYAGSLALTPPDWKREFRVFTGEPVSTRAARSHILAEEGLRVLTIIESKTGIGGEARAVAEKLLGDRIFGREDSTAAVDGMYCCGKCSVAFWRCMAAGAYSEHGSTLTRGIATLSAHRDGGGGWKRFPFYYTLLFLAETDPELARGEIEYSSDRRHRAQRLLQKKTDSVSVRRLRLLQRLAS